MQDELTTDSKPVLDLLKFQPRAHIKCDSENSGSLEDSETGPFDFPHHGRLDTGWKNETCCFALADASVESSVSSTSLYAKIRIDTKYGGCCGRNVAQAYGGVGKLEPSVTGVLTLPRPDAGIWNIDMALDLDHSTETGRVTGLFAVSLTGKSGDPSNVHSFSTPFTSGNIPFHKTNVKPDVYDLSWDFPNLLRGCLGSRFGTRSESTTKSILTIVCRLS